MKIKKKAKEIGTVGNRKMRRNPLNMKNAKWRKVMEKEKEQKEAPAPAPPPAKPMSEADQVLVKTYLANPVGEQLVRMMEPLARRDLHPGNLVIAFNKEVGAIDISVVLVDTNTPIWQNLQVVMWRNRMTWRFDSSGPQLMLVVRWFLPYLFAAPGMTKPEEEPAPMEPPVLSGEPQVDREVNE